MFLSFLFFFRLHIANPEWQDLNEHLFLEDESAVPAASLSLEKYHRLVQVLREYAAFSWVNIRSWFRPSVRMKPFYPAGTSFVAVYTNLRLAMGKNIFLTSIDLDASALIQGDSATKRPNSFREPQTVPDKWVLKWYPSLTFYIAT